ncbi:hypothetical protein V3851_18650 [Paenibacillus sp. M1]|uniref:Photosynthesis system II assembly factor Ycf48/Hcf136-like domain-containing protein n=1 Tax=Paenibacillus haidiansis TaxID=1574488 RepID=A0ABU7VVQ2_9BACL
MKGIQKFVILLCFVLSVTAIPGHSFAKEDYKFTKQNAFFGSDLFDVAYGNGVYVAVGGDGAIVRSADSKTWSVVSSGTTVRILSVSFGGGVFVAVGEQNLILTSTDGIKWTKQTLAITKKNVPSWVETQKGDFAKSKVQTNSSVIWDGKQFVLLTQMELYVFKPDPYYPESANKVYNPSGYAFVSTSLDGVTWKTTQAASSIYNSSKIKYINGVYYIFSEYKALTSRNLVNWTDYSDAEYTDVAFGPGGLVIAYDRVESARSRNAVIVTDSLLNADAAKSKDLLEWSESGGPNSIDYVYDRYIINADGGYFLTSTDAKTWNAINMFNEEPSFSMEPIEDPGAFSLGDINTDRARLFKTIWDGRQFISVGAFGGIYTSPDMKSFEKHPVEGGVSPIGSDFYGIGFESGTYYLYGSNGTFLASGDAVQWKKPFNLLKNYSVLSASYNGEDYAFGAEEEDWGFKSLGRVYYFSVNRASLVEGVALSQLMYGLDHPIEVKWDGSNFIGRTRAGEIYKYDPASGWKDISPTNPQLVDNEPIIVSGNDHTVKYEYSDSSGTIMLYYMADGKWVKAEYPVWSEYEKYYLRHLDNNSKKEDTLSTIIYGNNEFMAVGAGGLILRSPDGKVWTKVQSGTSEYLHDLIWDGKQYIAVGNKGTYLTYTPQN